MLDRTSGKVIHIDFGDCFEVAMVREKFPEKIPFRLTRMLINAMEVWLTHVMTIMNYAYQYCLVHTVFECLKSFICNKIII